MVVKNRISKLLKARVFYFAVLIVTSACSELLVGSQFFTQGSSEEVYIKHPDQKVFRTGEVAVFRVQYQGKILKSYLTKKNIELKGRDLKGCETKVINGDTAAPQIHIYGCKTLSNDLSFVLSGNIYTKLNGVEPITNLQSDEIIFDNSTPFEFKVEIGQNKALYLPVLNNEDRHFRVNWGDGNIDFFRKGLNKDKLFHVYEQPGTYDVSISGNFKNFHSSRVFVYRNLDGDNSPADAWNKGEKEIINLTSKVKPPILVDIGGLEQRWIKEETDKIEIKINHENVGFISIESEALLPKDIKSIESAEDFLVYGNHYFTRCLQSSFGSLAATLRSVKELGSIGWNNMAGLFCKAKNLMAVSGGDTSQVTDMSYMFFDASQATPETSGWETSKVTSMAGMFRGAAKANPNTSGWITSKVINMERMFERASQAEPVTTTNMSRGVWDTSNVTNMAAMFNEAVKANPDTSGWVTSKVTNMSWMFRFASQAEPVTTTNMSTGVWDTSNVTNMGAMFENASRANPDTSNWVTSKVTNMAFMFRHASQAEPITTTNMSTGVWDTSNATSMAGMFESASKANPNTSNWVTSKVADMGFMFRQASQAEPVTTTNMSTGVWDTSNVTSMAAMFESASKANPNTSNWVTSKVTNMSSMFRFTSQAEPVTTTDMSTGVWDTSKVTNMWAMFEGASRANPDTSSWVTSKVTDMGLMFRQASQAEPITTTDMSTGVWDTSNVTNMVGMFESASKANPNTSNWVTSKVTNMSSMFRNTSQAEPITITDMSTGVWDTSKVTNMWAMFESASRANPDTSSWVTSKVTDMGLMFRNTPQANPDTSSWDLGSIFFGVTTDKNISGLGSFFNGSYNNLTTENYSSFLINLANVQAGSCATYYSGPDEVCYLNVRNVKYNSSAQSARDALVEKGWNIVDGGLIDEGG